MNIPLTRRRFFALAAVTASAVAVPLWFSGRERPSAKQQADGGQDFVAWQGIALGSGAQIRLYHEDHAFAEAVIRKALAEVARLEKIFSLYREDSEISRLNREGRLHYPSTDMLAVLSLAGRLYRLTDGAFDPSIQPLWNAYADFFRRNPDAVTPPPETEVNRALRLVGFDKVAFDSQAVTFAERGMGLSLNGIAQGYITDKTVELLRKSGIRQALVDMGEIRGLDTLGQRTWQVGIKNPQDETDVLLTVPLQNEGFATSGGYGTVFNAAETFTHLFDPRTGGAQPRYRSISVMAESAAVADALATAFAIMDETEIRRAAEAERAKVWLVDKTGKLMQV
ncbi:FAD:protein FMN transferase [Neisseria animalis]|uniref:FAD:protein FMN transferase n=1 Tax=Neisseria animalis TaxID=492 RepID=A0A5P3MTX3_NEIAN|nr:FAD:protein FMN transferase [Neisseria animalis]QEY25014.1 FAD:protein FMN transferase [Neisseria animalis]ROW32252.1 FAD:protein FMN transferase [Neisseria animalis]